MTLEGDLPQPDSGLGGEVWLIPVERRWPRALWGRFPDIGGECGRDSWAEDDPDLWGADLWPA